MESLETLAPREEIDASMVAATEELLAGDYLLNRFVHLPSLKDFDSDPRWMAKRVGISVEQAMEYLDILISTGVWHKEEKGEFKVRQQYFNSVKSAGDFMALAAGLHSTLLTSENCWYVFENWTTSEAAVKNLVNKLDKAFLEFKEESKSSNSEMMVAFNFAISDVLKNLKKGGK